MRKIQTLAVAAVTCAGYASFADAREAQASDSRFPSRGLSAPRASTRVTSSIIDPGSGSARLTVPHASPMASPAVAAAVAVGTDKAWSEGDIDGSRPGRISGFMGWAFNVPLGSARDFAKNASLLGFELQFHTWVTHNLSIGASGEWVTYMDNLPRTTFSIDQADITARLYNQLQTTSVRLLAHYFLSSQETFQPYLGPHVGASWSTFDLEAADLVLSDTQFSINVGAEAGAIIPFDGGGPSALVNLRYSTSPAAEFRSIVSNVQSLGLLLGIGF